MFSNEDAPLGFFVPYQKKKEKDMSDNLIDGKVLFSGKEQTPTTSQVANPEGTTKEETETKENLEAPITRKEAMDLIKEGSTQSYRQIQSLTDKLASNFDAKLSEKLSNFNQNIELMKSTGVKLDDSEVAKARQKILDDTLAEPGQSTSDPNKPDALNQAGTQSKSQNDGMIENKIGQIDKQYGSSVMQDDPEAKLIKMDDPFVFVKTYEAAAEAKAKRLGTPVEARLSSMATGSNPSLDVETLAAKLIELQKDPRSNKEERKEITKKLEELEGK